MISILGETLPSISVLSLAVSQQKSAGKAEDRETKEETALTPHDLKCTPRRLATADGTTVTTFPFLVDPASMTASAMDTGRSGDGSHENMQQSFSLRLKLAKNFLPADPLNATTSLPSGRHFHLDALDQFVAVRCMDCKAKVTCDSFAVATASSPARSNESRDGSRFSGRLYPLPTDDWHELLDAWACHAETFHSVETIVKSGKVPLPKPGAAFISRNYVLLNVADIDQSALTLGGKRKTRVSRFIFANNNKRQPT